MIEQRTEAWHQQRCGKLTASRFSDILSVLKSGKSSESRSKYMREIVFEILSGVPKQSSNAQAMKWGTEIEQYARESYELYTGNIVQSAEFTLHPQFQYVGCSPDGLIDFDGGIEIKCPHDESKHIQTLLEGMPQEHIPQIQGTLFVTGRKWWDFVSYDPRQGEDYRLYIQRVYRDEKFINDLRERLIQFWNESCEMVCLLKNRKAPA